MLTSEMLSKLASDNCT